MELLNALAQGRGFEKPYPGQGTDSSTVEFRALRIWTAEIRRRSYLRYRIKPQVPTVPIELIFEPELTFS